MVLDESEEDFQYKQYIQHTKRNYAAFDHCALRFCLSIYINILLIEDLN